MGSKGGEEGMVGSEGGERVGGSERGEGVDAYCMEYKTTTKMLLLSLSLSLVSLCHVLATLLTATWSCLPIGSFVALGPCT